jgi:hypothetical protein
MMAFDNRNIPRPNDINPPYQGYYWYMCGNLWYLLLWLQRSKPLSLPLQTVATSGGQSVAIVTNSENLWCLILSLQIVENVDVCFYR